MLRNIKTKFLLRNLLPKSISSTIYRLFKNLPTKIRSKKGTQESSNSPPTDIKEIINTSIFLTNLDEVFSKPKNHKAKSSNKNLPIKAINSTYPYLKRQFLALLSKYLAIHKFFKNLILKTKGLKRTLKNLLIDTKTPTVTNIFLAHLRKTLLGPINVFTTYVERSLSPKEHIYLISCIVVKALTIGITSFVLILVLLGLILLL